MIEYNEERKLENGTYYIRNKQYGTYFQNNGQNNNTTLSGFTGASNQQWRITEDSNNDYSYYISPMEQQHVLVTGQQMNSPPKVVFQTGGPTPGMRSRIVSNYDNTSSPDGSFRIMSVAYENLSIHAANPGTCTMYPYSASDVCRNWEFEKVQPIEDGTYYIKNVGSQKYMYASGDYIHQYANKLIANQTYVDRQHFKFVSQPNGSYHIIPLGGGYVNPDGSYMYALQANVAGDIKWDNYPVPASGYSHEFIIHQRPNGTYYIIPKLCSNRGMRVADNTTGTIATTDFISAATIHMEWQLEHKFNGGTFSMQNNGSKKYMFATNEWIEQRDRLNAGEIGIDRQRYRFIQQSSGAYHIIPLGGKYVNPDGSFQYALQANSAGNIRWGTYPTPDQNYYLEFDIQQNVNGTYYIKPGVCNNRGMRVANDAIGTKATTNLLSATNEYMEWRFEEITKFSAIVYNYYDSGFIFYLQNEHSASTPVSDINTIQQIINTKFLDEFNLNITSYNALAYTTTVDLCKRGIANFTTTNIHNRCRSTTMDIHNVQHDFCTYTSIMWSDFNPPNKGNCQTSIALWTGHTLYVDDEYEKDANGNYILDPQENKILQKLGEESNRSFIGGYYIMNSHRSHPGYERFGGTAFHELMHFFGAPDTYCRGDFEEDEDGNIIGTQCSNEICTTCYTNTEYEADCIMTTSGSYFVADSPICNKCKNDVREHLLANH